MSEILQAIEFFFTQSWRFFSEVEVPVLGFSFGSLFIGLFLMAFALRLLMAVLGILTFGSGDKKDGK